MYPKTTARMADIGAYNENSKYTIDDVNEIVEEANRRGKLYETRRVIYFQSY